MKHLNVRGAALSVCVLALLGTAACTKKSEGSSSPAPAAQTQELPPTPKIEEEFKPELSARFLSSNAGDRRASEHTIEFTGRDGATEFKLTITQATNTEYIQSTTVSTKIGDVEYIVTGRCDNDDCTEASALLTRVTGTKTLKHVFKYSSDGDDTKELKLEKSMPTEAKDLNSALVAVNAANMTPVILSRSNSDTPPAPGVGVDN